MRIAGIILAVVLAGGAAETRPADPDAQRIEAAKARLAQKQTTREKDESGPSSLTKKQESELRAQVVKLQGEISRLKSENAKLAASVAKTKERPATDDEVVTKAPGMSSDEFGAMMKKKGYASKVLEANVNGQEQDWTSTARNGGFFTHYNVLMRDGKVVSIVPVHPKIEFQEVPGGNIGGQ